MPTSRLPKPDARAPTPPGRGQFLRPLVLITALAILLVAVVALPASAIRRFLPPGVAADDFSGTLWHGSTGKITVNSLDAGALEWRIHPWSLLTLTLSADLHWVRVGFVADGSAEADRHGVTIRNAQGGGPIEDLSPLGLAAGWRGRATFNLGEFKIGFDAGTPTLISAAGDLGVAGLAIPQIANGTDLGGCVLHLAPGAVAADGDTTAELEDTGGPVELQAVIHFSARTRTGLLSGTIKDRPGAPAALRRQIDDLAQLHARDAQGRIPVELEFTL